MDVRLAQVPVLFAAVVLVGSNAFVLTPILSDVAEGLGASPFRIAWAISAFGAATAVSALLFGGLVDRAPARRVLGGAAALLALAQLSSAMSQNWQWLCLSQAVTGLATGVLLPGTYATTTKTAPPGREAARLGIILTGWSLSLVLAVPLAAIVAEHAGWRAVYLLIGAVSAVVAVCLATALQDDGLRPAGPRASSLQAVQTPGVALLLLVIFGYMTAFYGSFVFFGEAVRHAFGLSSTGTGVFVLAYGLGFGLAGIGLGFVSPRITRGYIFAVLVALCGSYGLWRFALLTPGAAFFGAAVWGFLNQLGVNALIVSLSRCAAEARGAVMGLHSAVTYLAAFAGPMLMGPVYAAFGFPVMGMVAAGFVLAGAVASWRSV